MKFEMREQLSAPAISWHWEVTEILTGKFHLSLFEDCRYHFWCRRVFASQKRANIFAARFSNMIYSYDWLFKYGEEASIYAFDKFFVHVEDEWIIYRQWLIQVEEWMGDFTVTLNDPSGGESIVQPVVKDEIFIKNEAVKDAIALIDKIELSRCVNPNQLSLF